MPSTDQVYRTGRLLVWLVLGITLVYVLAPLAVSFLPAPVMVGLMGSLSGAGDAGATVAERFSALAIRARVTSGVLLALWLALCWQRRWFASVLGHAAVSARAAVMQALRQALTAPAQAWKHEPAGTVLFLLILAAGSGLRAFYLGRDLRHDEAWTYMVYGRRPVWLSPLLLTDVNHHPLNTLLIHASVALFGNGLPAIRLPAFVFGIACIPAGYGLARAIWGSGAALIAAALIAGASPLIEYSVNARGYTAVTFCTLLMLWAGQNALRRESRGASTWPVAALAGIAGCYANIVMMLPGIMAFGWFTLLALGRGRGEAWPAIRQVALAGSGVIAGSLILYLPFFTVSGWNVIASSQGIKSQAGVAAALALFPGFVQQILDDWGRDVWPVCAWTAAALALGSVVLARRQRLMCLALLGAMAAALLFQFIIVRDPGPDRVWLSFLPPLLILTAAGLDGVLAWTSSRVVLPGVVALSLVSLMAVAVNRSATLLTSIETAYFPAARDVAAGLVGMGRTDLLAITAVRSDEVAYFAMREGLLLQPVRTDNPIRLLRPVDAPIRPGAGTLTIVIDKLLQLCTVDECVRQALADVPADGTPELVRDTPDYTELKVARAQGH